LFHKELLHNHGQSLRKVLTKFEKSPNPGGLDRYPMKAVIMMAFTLLIIQGISELIKNSALLRGHPNSGSMHEGAISESAGEVVTKEVTG